MGAPISKEAEANHSSNQRQRSFDGHREAVTCMKITDKYVFTASRDGEIREWTVPVTTCNSSI